MTAVLSSLVAGQINVGTVRRGKMKARLLALLALAAALAITPAAKADSSFDFSYTADGGVSGSGTLVGTDLGYDSIIGSEEWLITYASGTFDDGTNSGQISLIQNPDPAGSQQTSLSGLYYDDLLFPAGTAGVFVDYDGLLFNFDGMELNLYSSFGGTYWYEDSGAGGGPGAFEITPEPETLLLFCTGLIGLVGILFWKGDPSGLPLK
jgi:hypothetical protein